MSARRTGTVLAVAALLLAAPAAAFATESTPSRYLTQRLDWKPCFDQVNPPPGLPPGGTALECARYTAPMNWRRPRDGKDISVAITRLRATGARQGVLFTNPGGPGQAGRAFPLDFLATGQRAVLAGHDVYGIDVRGTGGSSQVSCDPVPPPLLPDWRDRSPANLNTLLQVNVDIARACQNSELGKFVNTEQTAHDLDLLRHLLGERKINYYGLSGGAWLGPFYATYFPHRVGRFVLDSVADLTSTWQDLINDQARGMERRFRTDFLPWLARHHDRYGWGATAAEAGANYETVRARLAAKPVELNGNKHNGASLDVLIIGALGQKETFPGLAESLALLKRLSEGAPVAESAATQRFADDLLKPDPAAQTGTALSIICNDTPYRGGRAGTIADSERLGRKYPLMGWHKIIQQCMSWQRPELRLPTITGRGLPPMLLVNSVRDPQTTLEGAQRAQRVLPKGSPLLVVADEGDHWMYLRGNACVDARVSAYLSTGALPANGSTCAGNPLPDPTTAAATPRQPFPAIG
ncbi:alpha/beta hydrolase [Crossiella sp. CA198]|uniref:alpha/beta hydrolase n=1 Tax=Crossiella sp. CA198 TaxID=3455607 RepID=UPI003F8D36F3